MALLLLLLVQTQGWSVTPARPTVGDSIVIERLIPLEGVEPRARVTPLEPSGSIQPLEPPSVSYESAGIRIRFTVAAFAAETISVDMPDIELIMSDGTVEIAEGGTATLLVESILPETMDSLPTPRPSQAPIGRSTRNPVLPVLVPGLFVLLTLTWGTARRWRRPRPRWDQGAGDVVEPPVGRWIQAGEPRAVAALALIGLRERLSKLVPKTHPAMSVSELLATLEEHGSEWSSDALKEAFTSLERASFAPAVSVDVLATVGRAEQCLRDLEATAAEATDSETTDG